MSPKKLATLIESLHDTVAGLSWEPDRHGLGRLRRQHQLRGRRHRSQGARGQRRPRGDRWAPAWDLGANTGRYSRIAAEAGYRVVALDIDPAAVERGYRAIKADGRTDITPLLGDITAPSPALGWANAERASLLERVDADVVLALALVHHLAIGANVPLPMIASLFARMAPMPSSSSCPRRTRWCSGSWRRVATSSPTTTSRASVRVRAALRDRHQDAHRGQRADRLPPPAPVKTGRLRRARPVRSGAPIAGP